MSPRRMYLAALVLAGCNQVFGLEPPSIAGDGGVDGPTRAPGRISAASHDYMRPTGAVTEHFLSAELGPPAVACVEEIRSGACVAAICDDVVALERPHMGNLTFAGVQTVEILPNPDGSYTPVNGPGPLFAPASMLAITASGNDTPPFNQSIATPSSVVFTSPMPVLEGNAVPIVRQSGFLALWSNGVAGTIVTLTLHSDLSPLVVYCQFDGGAASGNIEPAVLLRLPAGDGDIYSGVLARHVVIAGDFAIELEALVVGKHDFGDMAAGPIFLQ